MPRSAVHLRERPVLLALWDAIVVPERWSFLPKLGQRAIPDLAYASGGCALAAGKRLGSFPLSTAKLDLYAGYR